MTVKECMMENHEGLAEGITALILRNELDNGVYNSVLEIPKSYIEEVRFKVLEWLDFDLEV